MTTPHVSILLPTYNHAQFVGQAVESILHQTYTDYEFIIVDDGSTDSTDDILGSYKDDRICLIRQGNTGIAGALNTAFVASQGQYIAIMNDDDLWKPDKLEIQTGILDRSPHIDLVHAQAQVITATGEILPQKLGYPGHYPQSMLRSLLFEDCICPITVLMRRTAVESVSLWDKDLPGVDDWDMWLRLACEHRFQFISQVLAYYRLHPANFSGVHSPSFAEHQSRRVKVLDKFYRDSACRTRGLEMRPIAYRNLYTTIGLQWLSVREWHKGLEAFRNSLNASPHPNTLLRILMRLGLHALSHTKHGSNVLTKYTDWRLMQRQKSQTG